MNDPEKWTNQMWVLPGEARLERDKEKWSISIFNGLLIPIEADLAERIIAHLQRQGYQSPFLRENVSYAVGDPYGIFDHIPHRVNPDGSVTIGQEAILKMWKGTHDWEPMMGWTGTYREAYRQLIEEEKREARERRKERQ